MPLSRIPGLRQLPQRAGAVYDRTVLFDSWRGQFSDNPRAIFEELVRREEPLAYAWVLNPALSSELPPEVEAVAPRSRRHLELMGRARYLVANSTVLGFHVKRPGTTFLQTWHGTPLKQIGFGIPHDRSRAARQAIKTLRHNVSRWDLLLSPNAFSTPIFRTAFDYTGPIVETGYPRNDLLRRPRNGEIRARVRERLGIADTQQAVLYAPTFRDGASFGLSDGVSRLAQILGSSYVVLLRTHVADARGAGVREIRGVRDVSSYPDNRELYLAADVLVTDYSSVMFDFAVTGKPMVFFVYDLAHYRDEVRGFYFDLEEQAPGPLVSTVDQLAHALQDLESVTSDHEAAYARFVERFCALEDGRASERAVDAMLEAS